VTRSVLALAAALLARAVLAAPAALPPGATGDVQVTGDRVTFEPATGRILLEGNALVKRGTIVLRARSAEWDPATGEVRASGSVLLTDPTRVVAADAVRAVIGGDFEAEGVVAFVKDRPVDLSEVRSVAEAGRRGRNRLGFSTPHLRGDGTGRMRLTDARLTLCDCPGGAPPSWEVTARDADVIPGDRAILRWPVLRIAPPFAAQTYPVPLLRLPWLYVPLGERQSGLLIPTIGSTYAGGFTVNQPLFLTLGRSADATITADWANGHKRSRVLAGEPSIRGPGARLELRWAPAVRAEGRLELSWLHDLDAEPGGAHGDRAALLLTHRQVVGQDTAFVAGLRLAGDPVWVRDSTPDVLARSVPYRRSDLLVSRRGDVTEAEVVASYLQPLDPVATTGPWGTLGARRGVASRLGATSLDLVPEPLGPLQVSGKVGAARFGPVNGVARPGDPAQAAAFDSAGRLPVTRADARAELALPLLLGRAVTLAPYVRGASLAYAPDGAEARGVGWGVAGAMAETEVSRRFGEVRHVIAPRLEWRAGTGTLGRPLDTAAYDLYDRARGGQLSASPGVFDQLRASIETRLETARATVLRLELGQDADLLAGRFAEAFTALGVAAGPFTGDAGARFYVDRQLNRRISANPSTLDRFTELHASVGLHDRRGDSVAVGFFSVGPGGSGRLVAGLDPIFDVRPAPIDAGSSGSLSVRANLGGGARVGYDALVSGRPAWVGSCTTPTALRRIDPVQIQQHAGSLTWDSPCRCFRLILAAHVDDCGNYSYSANIDFGRPGATMSSAPPAPSASPTQAAVPEGR
jgi:LPS-assembly protein